MKIYVDEGRQVVRVDFGEKGYILAELNRFAGEVGSCAAPASWLPNVLGYSELVYESPAPPLEWPTKPNALVEAKTTFRAQERFICQGNFWAAVEDGTEYYPRDLELKRIIFEGEDNG